MIQAKIISRQTHCPYCEASKIIFEANNIKYDEQVVGVDLTRDELISIIPPERLKEKLTVPQIWIDGVYIGGHEDLQNFIQGHTA